MIGSVGPSLPHAVLRASGRYAGPLDYRHEGPTPRAYEWLEGAFPPFARGIVEKWAKGAFDHLESVVFSRGEDATHRLYYYLTELRRVGALAGPEPIIFDVAKIPRDSSVARMEEAVRGLAARLGVDDAALEAAIREGASQSAVRNAAADRVCLLTGTPPPDRRLHDVIEAAGFLADGPTLAERWQAPAITIEQGSGDPAAAIARALHADPAGARSFADPTEALIARVHASRAAAVVLWRIEEDEAEVWHLPRQRQALAAARVPHLILTRRDWFARDGAGAEIARFLEGIAS